MPMNNRAARVGAAAFVLGLSLAGPHAAGTAAADTIGSDDGAGSSAGASATTSHPASRGSATRAPRSGTNSATPRSAAGVTPRASASESPAGEPVSPAPSTTAPKKTAPKAKSSQGRSLPSAPRPAAVLPGAATTVASQTPGVVALPVAAATSVLTTIPHPAAAVTSSGRLLPTLRTWLHSRPTPGAHPVALPDTRVPVITAAVNKFLDTTKNWLSALPSGPVNEFLQGALLLVRRTLSSFLPGVSTGGTTVTTTASPYFTDQQMRDYLLGLAKEQYGGLFGQTVPYYPYPYYEYLKAADGSAARDTTVTSDTNTQVAGVDEADFIENDGRYLYVAQNGRLTIFDAASHPDAPTVASQTELSGNSSVVNGNVVGQFLSGDRLTVITSSGSGYYAPWVRMAAPWYWNPQTTVTVLDVTDRTAPTVVTQTVYDGAYRDARAVDGTVYVVMDRGIRLPAPAYTESTVYPDPVLLDGDPQPLSSEAKIRWDPDAPMTYRTYESWDSYVARVGPNIVNLSLPHAYSVDADGNLVDLGVFAGPGDIVRPKTNDQQSLVTVVSIDSKTGTDAQRFADSVGTLAYSNGTSIYMTPDALYIASNQDDYSEHGSSTQTRIDRFTVDGADIGWQASGLVPGSPVNQFSMDEHDGHLHVATHTWSWDDNGGTWTSHNDNGVYVLDTAGDTLDITGSLTGLAPGEQLYATRFVGNTAYLVTFQRTDPLFVIDLGDPTAPKLQGELEIPGFSNYLQPVGDGVLLGIGQERPVGTTSNQVQVSLFDVRGGGDPTQIERIYLDPGSQWSWSEAQFDHHALLYSPEDGLLVVPVTGSGYDPKTGIYRYGQTLQILRVGPDGIEEVGVIKTDGTVIRTARIGDVLYAVSPDHVTAYRLDDLSVISSA